MIAIYYLVYLDIGIGVKHNIKIIIANIPSIILLLSSGVTSFNGGGCIVPIKKIIINAKINHPDKLNPLQKQLLLPPSSYIFIFLQEQL